MARFKAAPRTAHGKPGARAYAIGDVHGCLEHLDALLEKIGADMASRPALPTYLLFLGDLIDRGPHSAQVIDRVIALGDTALDVVCLKGNHEEFLLRALDGEEGVIHDWLDFGGRECVASYGLAGDQLAALPERQAIERLRAIIPARHRQFLADCPDSFRFGDYLFVHAGIRPGLPIDLQRASDLRWIREPFLSDRADHGFVVVHGHTIEESIVARPNRVCLDTGVFRTGVLSAVAIEDDRREIIQVTAPAPAAAR